MCYEGNFDNAAFKLPFGLENIYKLVHNCFAEFDNKHTEGEDDDADDSFSCPNGEATVSKAKSLKYKNADSYQLQLELDNGTLHLLFRCVVGGFLDVEFDLRLREKIMSNDAQLSIHFQRVEQSQLETVERIDTISSQMQTFTRKMGEMERRLEALGHADICFTNPPSNDLNYIKSWPIDAKQLTIQDGGNHTNTESFKKIKFFYQLEELTMNGFHDWNGKAASIHTSNTTVKKLTLINSPVFNDISFIQNFPSLIELSMSEIKVDVSIVTTLRSIKHKIKKLTFQSCKGINQTEMQTYCTQNNITLNLS
jgi:hypothetical protein